MRNLDKLGRTLGFSFSAEGTRREIEKARTEYADKLRLLLGDAGVTVVPSPEVPHREVFRRAAARRRPCDAKGDGYRDTLNWLTVVELARKHAASDVIWATANTADFGNGLGSGLHQDLLEDLRTAAQGIAGAWPSDDR